MQEKSVSGNTTLLLKNCVALFNLWDATPAPVPAWQEHDGDIQLEANPAALKFTTKFVVLNFALLTPDVQVCSKDCDGGGEVNFKISGIMTETYTILLGDQKMGNLEVPPHFEKDEGVCFGGY